jgi:hypothetical protein
LVNTDEQSRPIRLREMPNAAPTGRRVIDASYEIVRGKRGVLGAIWIACLALFWAALIGFLIPPAWVIAARLFGN